MTTQVFFNGSINAVQQFVSAAQKCPVHMEFISEEFCANAKSLLDILCLDLSKNLTLRVDTDKDADVPAELRPFFVQ